MNEDIRMSSIVLNLEVFFGIPEDLKTLLEKEVLSLIGEPELCSPMRDCLQMKDRHDDTYEGRREKNQSMLWRH